MKEKIREKLLNAGASKAGFALAGEIDSQAHESFAKWIAQGHHGNMKYMERHLPLRKHTDSVLPGAKSVISMGFSYVPQQWRKDNLPAIAVYAYGEDYHFLLRERLNPVVKELRDELGGKWRICIDSAPVAERYWALKSGIGKRGLNGSVIIDGCGGMCFLVEILTTLQLEPDDPVFEKCEACGKCIDACPAKAILPDGTIDARRCINYLTIEKKEPFSPDEMGIIRSGNGYLFGCDSCLKVCPHNFEDRCSPSLLFSPIPAMLNLTAEDIKKLNKEEFNQKFSRSPLGYGGYERLKRNAEALESKTASLCNKDQEKRGSER